MPLPLAFLADLTGFAVVGNLLEHSRPIEAFENSPSCFIGAEMTSCWSIMCDVEDQLSALLWQD